MFSVEENWTRSGDPSTSDLEARQSGVHDEPALVISGGSGGAWVLSFRLSSWPNSRVRAGAHQVYGEPWRAPRRKFRTSSRASTRAVSKPRRTKRRDCIGAIVDTKSRSVTESSRGNPTGRKVQHLRIERAVGERANLGENFRPTSVQLKGKISGAFGS